MHSIIIDSKLGYDKLSANDATSEPESNKNRMGHRMHVEGSQIFQINRHINSFQNFYDAL